MKRLALLLLLAPVVASAAYVPLVTEVLVLNSAPVQLPDSTNRRAISIQNLGPNAIYCAFSASANAVLTKSIKIGNGETFSMNFPAGISIWCRAATADQLTGAATIVTEI